MKRRLIIAIVGVAAVAVIIFGTPLALVVQRSYRDEELLRLQRDTVASTRSIDPADTGGDHPELPGFQGRIAVYDLALTRVAGSGPAHGDPMVRAATHSRAPEGVSANERLVVAIPLFRGERIVGAVRGERSQEAADARTHRAWLELALLAGAVILLTVVAAIQLARRLARPMESLASVARRVGDGDFAARAQPSAIAEIDELAAALNISSVRIAELIAREREFSANASHQLRTPLAALRLELESALLSGREGPEVSAALQQADRLETTIDTLLALARRGPVDETRHADVDLALGGVRARWHGRLAAAGRPLRIVTDTPLGAAATSPAVLDEILDILLQNALDHGAGTVRLTVRHIGAALAIEISDQGPGFSGDPKAAFTRGVGTGEGIGLSLARSLAHAEGALLQITNPGPSPQITLLVEPDPRPGNPLGQAHQVSVAAPPRTTTRPDKTAPDTP